MQNIEDPAADRCQNKKVYFLVIDYIKTLIQNKTVSFGEKLPSERQMMATLGLSRNSIREALRSLENMGVIESRHGQGNFLVNHIGQSLGSIFSLLLFMDECSYLEIIQLRRSIETSACLLAAAQATDQDIRTLASAFHAMEQGNLQERTILDKKFHDTLIGISGNRLLKLFNETLSQLFESTIHEIRMHVSDKDWKKILDCHAKIYQGLAARDAQAAMDAVMKHYDLTDVYYLKLNMKSS